MCFPSSEHYDINAFCGRVRVRFVEGLLVTGTYFCCKYLLNLFGRNNKVERSKPGIFTPDPVCTSNEH